MNQSGYFFVAVVFAVFLGTVVVSNMLAYLTGLTIDLRTKRKARRS